MDDEYTSLIMKPCWDNTYETMGDDYMAAMNASPHDDYRANAKRRRIGGHPKWNQSPTISFSSNLEPLSRLIDVATPPNEIVYGDFPHPETRREIEPADDQHQCQENLSRISLPNQNDIYYVPKNPQFFGSLTMMNQYLKTVDRKLRLERYRNKKKNATLKIRYKKRQEVAENRIRFRGRFISQEETQRIIATYGSNIVKQGRKVQEFDTNQLPYEEVLKHSLNVRRLHKGIQKALAICRKKKVVRIDYGELFQRLRSKSPVFTVHH
eukprot:TRINITY_DN1143_c0_g1_i4.p1 TRINITY_DN1143_c0_g1~~TRINITY_DN1143_c0_g1_i4.p1  ORF type:complete len:267 (+),score=29.08 TRINITY_DN1143_c0_g1_i4:222-1022(+)